MLEDYRVEQDRALAIWNLLENGAIWAQSRHTGPLDPMAGFKEIMKPEH